MSAALFLASSSLVQERSGLLDAVRIAERTTRGQVMEVEAESGSSGRLNYELEVLVGGEIRELRIDSRSGRITTTSTNKLVSWVRNLFASDRTMRDFKPLSAIIVGLEKQSGGTVTEVEFEDDDHHLHYQIDISTSAGSASLYIDPISGQRLGFALED
ncbi:PepSY domain-containing protein [Croceicoccus pelagius]|uniref:PepSY domain-containing protein n=1 Tax=Croceicoccus pelagius TaxID=1703341 RepID=UPI001561053F|nr:PepSY domain-containing protein [Croceicoccus pelagius]